MVNYFAYGSNISAYRMLNERKVNFKSRKFAILENYKLIFNKVSKDNIRLGYANIEETKNSIVEGALYELEESDLKIIDKYEGVNSNHYSRNTVEVICNNEKVKAIVYIANPMMIMENLKPNKKYLNYILDGKDILSENYYNHLLLTNTLD